MNAATRAVHFVYEHARRAAEVSGRNTENCLISILCSSFTGQLFTISCFFSVVYRWHNIITAKLSSIQSAICFSVMEAFTPSARCVLLIRGEPSGGRGGNPAARLRESEGVSLPRARLVLSGCVSVGLHLFSSTSPLPLLPPLLLLLSRTCLPPHTSCTSLYLSHDSAAELSLALNICEEFSWSGVFFKTSRVYNLSFCTIIILKQSLASEFFLVMCVNYKQYRED